jgi:cbb3-type cytochrome c oxidase subunit III
VKRLAIVVALAIACGGDERQGLTADSAVLQYRDSVNPAAYDPGTRVDSLTGDSTQVDSAAIAGPTFVLLADSAEGDVLYRRKGKCLSCHGLSGKGLEGLGPNLQDTEWLHGDGSIAFIQRTIVEGIARPKVSPTVMPALASILTPEEIFRIAAYVYTLSHPGSAVADTTRLPVDTLPVTDTIPPTGIPPVDTVPLSHPPVTLPPL